jgi:cobalt/nickel transport system ATP-binding protein
VAISVKNLNYAYPNGFKALEDISCEMERGKKTAVLGLNGSGKSTLLQHFNGIILPQTGSVKILGMESNKKNLNTIREKVGFLFDYPDHQLFSTTVYKDIQFGLDNFGCEEKEKERRIEEVSEHLGIVKLWEKVPHQLSLGQKKKVATAGLLVLKPEIVVCDEPFSGLDSLALEYFKNLLDSWVEEGRTVVFSTHDVNLTYEWADNVLMMRRGKLLHSGSADIMGEQAIYEETGLSEPTLYRLFKDRKDKPRTLSEAIDFIRTRNGKTSPDTLLNKINE